MHTKDSSPRSDFHPSQFPHEWPQVERRAPTPIHPDKSELILHRLEAMEGSMNSMQGSLTKLAESMSRLAIAEERIAQVNEALGRAFKAIEAVDTRVGRLELAAPLNNKSTQTVDKVIWLVIAAVVGALLIEVGLK